MGQRPEQQSMPANQSFLGDAGHFISSFRAIYLNNPDGRSFAFTAHRYMWPTRWEGDGRVLVHGPDGREAGSAEIKGEEESATIEVAAGQLGVYAVRVEGLGYRLTWFECSLGQMVVDCGDWEERRGRQETFDMHTVTVPRRWYFFVPEGVSGFEIASQHGSAHRQDSGLVVFSPRGQPVAAHFGSRPRAMASSFADRCNMTPGWDLVDEMPDRHVMRIETDPGSTGRFWSIWLCGGDGHCYSPLQVLLDGVPPYLSSMPEQWFNPQTGRAAPVVGYDFHSGPSQRTSETFCAPCPLLGDTDTGMRGKHSVYLRNPENRSFDFMAAGYIIPEGEHVPVHFRAAGPEGEDLGEADGSFTHRSPPEPASIRVPAAGAGVYEVEVDSPRWYGWSEPSMPTVLAGAPVAGGGARFSLMLALGRHWFFGVPEGTEEFLVRVEIADPNHALQVEINAPDRIVQVLYAQGGAPREVKVPVPEGLGGKVWFLRLSAGSSTRLLDQGAGNRRTVQIDPDVELHGVPGYLAPTWEQWFDPGARNR